MEADVGMQLEVTNIWIRVPVETAIEDWMVTLTERTIRPLLKAWI